MFELFSKNCTSKIVLSPNAEACIKLAAADLRKNLLSLSGRTEGFEFVTKEQNNAITVTTDPVSAPDHIEGYSIEVKDDGVWITGSDALGTVYGIYAFATKCLGIDPMYLFTDLFPKQKESLFLKPTSIVSRPKYVRFRGWFINDEDLLTCFRPNGGRRAITYNQDFFKKVISPTIMDRILETALRLEINTIIPSSFIDILNPAEEAIIRVATDRGFYVSQHHQEPVGVAHFAAENYVAKYAKGKEVSYVKEPQLMEMIWRTYIEQWAKYGDRVIWQLGLRGKGDKAVWNTDNSISSSKAERGDIISRAIATQHQIISKILGHDRFLSTCTLWMEGAELYDKGYLKLPHGTIAVFSDIGYSQLFSSDLYQTKHIAGESYGVYYHSGFYCEGPHMAEGTDLEKMVYCYRDAERYDSLRLSILNVANIRELCHSIRLNAALISSPPSEFDIDSFYRTEFETVYGATADSVINLDREYYKSIGDLGKEIAKQYIGMTDFHYHEYGSLPFPYFPLTDGMMCRFGGFWLRRWDKKTATVVAPKSENFCRIRSVLCKSLEHYRDLLSKLEMLEPQIPADVRHYYRFSQMLRCQYMMEMTRWLYAVSNMVIGQNAEENRSIGIEALNQILVARSEFSRGKWEGWYDGDLRLNIIEMRSYTAGYTYEKM